MEKIDSVEELDRLILENKLMIIELGQSLCAPCKTIKMKLEKYLEVNKDVKGYYIDVEELTSFVQSLGVLSTPTVLVYIDHKLTLKESGYFSLEQLFDKLERIKKYYYSE